MHRRYCSTAQKLTCIKTLGFSLCLLAQGTPAQTDFPPPFSCVHVGGGCMAAGVPGMGICIHDPLYFYVHSKQNLCAFSNMRTHFVEYNSPSEKSEVLKRARCLPSLARHVTDMFYLKFRTKQNKTKTALHILRAAIRKLKKMKCFGTGARAPAQQHLASAGLSQKLKRTRSLGLVPNAPSSSWAFPRCSCRRLTRLWKTAGFQQKDF